MSAAAASDKSSAGGGVVHTANIDRFLGGATGYHESRPKVPAVVYDVVNQYFVSSQHELKSAADTKTSGGSGGSSTAAAKPQIKTVVDIGCGSGLSTFGWADRVPRNGGSVIGIEPNPDMRATAQAHIKTYPLPSPVHDLLQFCNGTSTSTGLGAESADVVTVSQALHWMEPAPTFVEIARILKPGGVFVSIDNDWPPAGLGMTAETTFTEFGEKIKKMCKEKGWDAGVAHFAKDQHLKRMNDSKQFRYCREVLVHSTEPGTVDRLVALICSQGDVQTAVRNGMTPEQMGVPELRKTLIGALGAGEQTWYFCYRLRVAMATAAAATTQNAKVALKKAIVGALIPTSRGGAGGGSGLLPPLIQLVYEYAVYSLRTITNAVLLAGDGRPAYRDGVGTDTASFKHPSAMCVSLDGSEILIADTGNKQIRVFSRLSDALVWTLAPNATFVSPQAITPHPTHPNCYFVSDQHMIRYCDARGGDRGDQVRVSVVTLAGDAQSGYADRSFYAGTSYFNTVRGLRCTSDGRRLYICDSGNDAIRMIDLDAKNVSTIVGGIERNRLLLNTTHTPHANPNHVVLQPRMCAWDKSLAKPDECLWFTAFDTSGDFGGQIMQLFTSTGQARRFEARISGRFHPFGIDITATGVVVVTCIATHSIYTFGAGTSHGFAARVSGLGVCVPGFSHSNHDQTANQHHTPSDVIWFDSEPQQRVAYVLDSGNHLLRAAVYQLKDSYLKPFLVNNNPPPSDAAAAAAVASAPAPAPAPLSTSSDKK